MSPSQLDVDLDCIEGSACATEEGSACRPVTEGVRIPQLPRKVLGRWLLPYLLRTPTRRSPRPDETVHALICVGDHFEPRLGNASPTVARARVEHWVREYPRQLGSFSDSDGRPPRHSFFFPAEEYEPEHLELLGDLCRAGFGEVEVHLHHDRDTPDGLRDKLLTFKHQLASRHGLLSRHRTTGELGYAFIHGNWALCNSRPDGRGCGMANELTILRETGCFADFTLPSAPSPTQTRKTNSIYYARDSRDQPKGHDWGVDVGTGPAAGDSLMLIQGPLLLDWGRRKWGLLPGLENGCLQANQPPSMRRLALWLRARIHVPTRPDWFFVKVYTHGAPENNHAALLGEPASRFHRDLAEHARRHPNFHYHYVTAREMYNLARAAESGWKGSVAEALNHEFVFNQ